jgi:hypothetical protein
MGFIASARTGAFAAAISLSISAVAAVPKDLPYPSGELSADQIMEQVYFVNHFYAFDNYAITQQQRDITVLVIKGEGKKPTTNTLERYLNNAYPADDAIKAQDLAIFRSGKLKGTGMLITDYQDDAKSQSYMIWLPALRKIRRFAEPAHDDAWGGSDFTFGDVALRKPFHEQHELLGKETFNDCLGYMAIGDDEQTRYTKDLPKSGSCDHKGKEVYKVKSTTNFESWWYDYRISYVDTKTFADYRTDYFKGDEQVKVIDRHWVSLGTTDDPRAQGWGYWYGKTLATGNQTWAVIPSNVNQVNAEYDENWWSERTLRKIKR